MTKPVTIGRVVLYTLTDDDAEKVNRRRVTSVEHRDDWLAGAQAHIGNGVQAGNVFPLLVTRHWGGNMVNGQVLLDGNDTLWVTSRSEGTTPGSWAWPEVV